MAARRTYPPNGLPSVAETEDRFDFSDEPTLPRHRPHVYRQVTWDRWVGGMLVTWDTVEPVTYCYLCGMALLVGESNPHGDCADLAALDAVFAPPVAE